MLCVAALGCAQPRAAAPPVLPLTTLRLYETGVGYFERSGRFEEGGAAALPIPAAHLDDALKTLVILDTTGKTRIDGVEFGSGVSRAMARAMAGLPQDADTPIGYRDLLVSLKGAAVEVRTHKQRYSGRLIEVLGDDESSGKGDKPSRADGRNLIIVLLLDTSELVRVSTSELIAIRATDASYANRLGSALDALSTRGAQSRRMMRVLSQGAGPLRLGYIAETPIWRTTYRLVLDERGGSVLQGWALVHNDTDEDWQRVRLELVNGRPDSFLFPLVAPRYARRELAHPEEQLSTVPQLVDQTADMLWGDNLDEVHGYGGLGLVGTGSGGGGSGHGYGSGSGRLAGRSVIGVASGTSSSSLLGVQGLADTQEAKGVEAGALFSYALAEPLQLRAHGSALVPFVQRPIEAEQITWLDRVGATARTAVRLVNTTQQTLPVGTMAFFVRGGFAGESSIERLKPGEKRFVRYGVDLDVEVREERSRTTDAVKRLTFDAGTVTEHFLRTRVFDYELENRSGQPRTLCIGLPGGEKAEVKGADRLELDEATGSLVMVFRSEPRQKTRRTLQSVEGLRRSHSQDALTAKWLDEVAAQPGLDAADQPIVKEAAAKLTVVEAGETALAALRKELAAVEADLQRWREHVKAINAEKAAAAPLVNRILAAEDRRAAIVQRIERQESEQRTRREAVRLVLARLKSADRKG